MKLDLSSRRWEVLFFCFFRTNNRKFVLRQLGTYTQTPPHRCGTIYVGIKGATIHEYKAFEQWKGDDFIG